MRSDSELWDRQLGRRECQISAASDPVPQLFSISKIVLLCVVRQNDYDYDHGQTEMNMKQANHTIHPIATGASFHCFQYLGLFLFSPFMSVPVGLPGPYLVKVKIRLDQTAAQSQLENTISSGGNSWANPPMRTKRAGSGKAETEKKSGRSEPELLALQRGHDHC